jgi:hypothetical protein
VARNFARDSEDPHVLEPIEAAHSLDRAATPSSGRCRTGPPFTTGSALLVDGGYTAR